MSVFIQKDSEASLQYGFDWADWLLSGDSISASAWSVSGQDESLTTATPDTAGTVTAITVSGGTAGAKYTLTNKVTTANGYVDRRSMMVRVIDK